jgi:hypothetical protein
VAETVTVKLPAHLALLIKPDAPVAGKLKVISGDVDVTPVERVTLLFFLCYDKDPALRSPALTAIKTLPPALAAEVAADPLTHPRLAELLQRFHPQPKVAPQPESAEEAQEVSADPAAIGECHDPAGPESEEAADDELAEEEPAEEEFGEIEEEEFRSKYQLAQSMGVGEKIKMALTGDKEWRSILIKDSNKLVNGAVVKNPRITEQEILAIAKSVIQNDEILRVICQNKEWVKNANIRQALVLNNKTPLPVALRFMGFLTEKDLTGMARSKNISSVLSNQARRMLAGKKKS